MFDRFVAPLFNRGSRACRCLALTVLVCFAPMATLGCYGSFPLTTSLYRFNGSVTNNNAVHSIIMLVLVFFTIYAWAFFLDIIIMNVIESLTGQSFHVGNDPDGEPLYMQAERPTDGDGLLRLNVMKEGVVVETHILAREFDGTLVMRKATGEITARFDRDANGRIVATDGTGAVVAMQ